jgi:hypothetical protein
VLWIIDVACANLFEHLEKKAATPFQVVAAHALRKAI